MTISASDQNGSPVGGNGSPPAPWFNDALATETDTDFKAYVANKNYPNAIDAARGQYNAEKLLGHDRAGRTVVLPKDDADTEGHKSFRAKLGVPDSPEGYKLPLPEGADPKFAKTAASWFHSNGIPPKAAEGIVSEWNKYVEAEMIAMDAEVKQRSEAELNMLKANMGDGFTKAEEFARRAANSFGKQAGLDDNDIKSMESSLGTAKFIKLLSKMGEAAGEGEFIGGDRQMGQSRETIQQQLKDIQTKRTKNEYTSTEWNTIYMPKVLELQEKLGTFA